MAARPTSASPPSARHGRGRRYVRGARQPLPRRRPRCASPKRVRRSSAIRIRPPSAASAMIASGISGDDELRQRPQDAPVGEEAEEHDQRERHRGHGRADEQRGLPADRASAPHGTSTNSANTMPAPSSAERQRVAAVAERDGQRGDEQRARDGGDAPGRVGERVHRLRSASWSSACDRLLGLRASSRTDRPSAGRSAPGRRLLLAALHATRAASAWPPRDESPVVSGRSSG